MDTIVAESTAPVSVSAIGIVRISGENALEIASRIFSTAELENFINAEPRRMYLGTVTASNLKDKAFCMYCKAPKSYTGEDIVEFHCHGGRVIIRSIIRACIELGARPALPGEFTKRAFINGKLTLDAAEGIADLISARSEAEALQAYRLMSGEIAKKIYENADRLNMALANLEAGLDYPEEILEDTKAAALDIINKVLEELKQVYDSSKKGSLVREGVTVAIAGLPNAGKSSLLNALLKDDRAIVTDIPGTTRDTLYETLEWEGVRINLVDTAGIRDSDDPIEKIGVTRAKTAIEGADLVVILKDGSAPETEEERNLEKLYRGKKVIIAQSKSDREKHPRNADIKISSKTGHNIEGLIKLILDKTGAAELSGSAILTRERHIFAVKEAIDALSSAKENFDIAPPDCTAVDIRHACRALAAITGTDVSEDVYDKIFSEFCVGK